jgi:hypothetical protein
MSGRLTRKKPRAPPMSTVDKVARNIAGAAIGEQATPGKQYKVPATAIKSVKQQLTQKTPIAPKKDNFAIRASRIATPQQITFLNTPFVLPGSELAEIELTTLAEAIFGRAYIRELMSKEIIRTVRDIWELSSPTTQCENIIGKIEMGKTPCWICSLPITTEEGLTPECEHVLPIAQAVVYLGLYSTSAEKQIFPKDMYVLDGAPRQALLLEYKWAHRVCNQIKNDDSYLDLDPSGKYIVRDDKIAGLIQRIRMNTRSYGSLIKTRLVDTSTAIRNATRVYQQICDKLNSYEAPKLLELAGIISAGYGPRKVGVDRGVIEVSPEEIKAAMEREIVKANIEYSGIVEKTWNRIRALPRLGPNAESVFLRIVEQRRPEYVSLCMRIKPTQANMTLLIAYIRQQLFSEFASVDGAEIGIAPQRRKDATAIFRTILEPLVKSMSVSSTPEFNEELMKANALYQQDNTIGDTIRTFLEKYSADGGASSEEKRDIQEELQKELSDTSGEGDPVNNSSEYVQIIEGAATISTEPKTTDSASVNSDPRNTWISDEDIKELLNSTDKWSTYETEAVDVLQGFRKMNVNGMMGGRR